MLSNAYFLAKFRFDLAENEPAKKLQNFANLGGFAPRPGALPRVQPRAPRRDVGDPVAASCERGRRSDGRGAFPHRGKRLRSRP